MIRAIDRKVNRVRKRLVNNDTSSLIYVRTEDGDIYTSYGGNHGVLCFLLAYLIYDFETANGRSAEETITQVYKTIVDFRKEDGVNEGV